MPSTFANSTRSRSTATHFIWNGGRSAFLATGTNPSMKLRAPRSYLKLCVGPFPHPQADGQRRGRVTAERLRRRKAEHPSGIARGDPAPIILRHAGEDP